jgi:hypothetical protein
MSDKKFFHIMTKWKIILTCIIFLCTFYIEKGMLFVNYKLPIYWFIKILLMVGIYVFLNMLFDGYDSKDEKKK